MTQTAPHISIAPARLVERVLGVNEAELAAWPEDVQELAASLAGELFLVRYNPFVDPDMVRTSVEERYQKARTTLSPEYEIILETKVAGYWKEFDADRQFRQELKSRLNQMLPPESISERPGSLIECATDATDLRMELPILVVSPGSAAEIQSVIRLANDMEFAIVPRGGGTGLTGGAIPAHRRTVILSLSRLKNIDRVDPEAMVLCAQAGVITQQAIKAAAEQGMLFTVDPASKTASSIGGNISENSGGPFAFEYGTTLDNILSFKMVTPKGELVEVRRKAHPRHKILPNETAVFELFGENGRLMDTVSLSGEDIRAVGLGKDVTNKYLGGLPGVQKEGVDGVITEGCFILHKTPIHSRVLVLEFFGRTMHNATLVIKDVVGLRDRIREEGDLVKISALEEFGTKYVQAIEYRKKSGRYEGEPISVLILQLDSDDEEALDQAVATVMDITSQYDNVDVFLARDDKEAELFWEDRHKLSAIAKRTSGFKINEDVVIPTESIPAFSDYIEQQNTYYLARAYRKALRQAAEIPGVDPDDEFIHMEIAFASQLIGRTAPGPQINDQELEVQAHFFFTDLKSRYPKLERQISELGERMQKTRVVIANHMHAGDGNCHVNLPVNSNDPDMLAQAHEAVERLFKKVLELKGGVSGEHGIGITKIAFLPEDKIKALAEYKRQVDPKDIFNPAKLTRREMAVEPYTFSFNRLIQDLKKTALVDKERLIHLLTNIQTCTRCGKCKQVCPMYYPQRGLLFHPRNKNLSLGALIEAIYYSQVQRGFPEKRLLDELQQLVEHCTACGKCTAVCPVKINTADVTLHMRAFLEEKGSGGHPVKSRVLHFLAGNPAERLPQAAKLMSLGQAAQSMAVGLIPAPWRRRFDNPLLQGPGPLIGYQNLAETLRLKSGSVLLPTEAAHNGQTVLYFPGCGAGLFHRSIGMASVYLLIKLGYGVALPPSHQCCGYPLLVSGCEEAYHANRRRNISKLIELFTQVEHQGLQLGHLLTSCGSCRDGLSRYDLAEESKRPIVHQDVLQLLLPLLEPLAELKGKAPEGLLYHASCHAEWTGQHPAKAPEAYRAALSRVLGTPVALSPGCCGESGLGALTSPAIYAKLRERKAAQLDRELGGYGRKDPILVGCPSCKIGIRRSLLGLGRPQQVLHALEYAAELLGGPRWKKDLEEAVAKSAGQTGGQAQGEIRRVSLPLAG